MMSLDRIAAFCAAGLIASSMLSHTVALRFLLLFAGAGFVVAKAVRKRESVKLVPPLWIIYAAWAAWAFLSLAWSPDFDRTLKELRQEVVYTAIAFWVCFAAAQARGATRIFLPILGVGAVIACSVSLYAYGFDRMRYQFGWHGGSGNHSSLLLTLAPCALATLWYGLRNGWRRTHAALAGALIALLLASAYATQNRTIWLGFGAELLLMISLVYAAQDRAQQKSGLRSLLVVLAVVGGAIGATATVHHERTAAHSALTLESDPRIALWADVMEYIEARPVTGYGFGRGVLRAELRQETGDGMLWHAHNIFLDVAVQLGIPGLVLFLLLLAATFREAWRLWRTRDDLQVACGIALAAIVVGMLARNMTDVLFIRQNALVYWGLAGTLLGLAAARAR
jgi:O-antigen ligase